MVIEKLYAGETQEDPLNSTGLDVANAVNELINQGAETIDSLSGDVFQRIGLDITPAVGTFAGANTRIIAESSDVDASVNSVSLYAGNTGTLKIKVFSVSGSTYTLVSSNSVTITSVGLNVFDQSDFGSIAVLAGHVVALYSPTDTVINYKSGTGFGVVSLTGDATSGTSTVSTTNIWQFYVMLSHTEQIVNYDNFSDLQNGIQGIQSATVELISSIPSGANRALITSTVAGEFNCSFYENSWRSSSGYALDNILGQCDVVNVSHVFSASDAVSNKNLISLWSDESDLLNLKELSATGAVDKKGIASFVGRSANLSAIATEHDLLNVVEIPPSTISPNPTGGFTCTGMTRDDRGFWIIANDGRAESTSPFLPSIVILTPSFTFWDEIALAPLYSGIGSVQGVAWDSSDNTVWFVDVDAKKVRHITMTGTVLTDELSLPSLTPNGLAYHPVEDALWVTNLNQQTVGLYSCADGSLITTALTQASADQIHWDGTYLWASYGVNGTDGNVEARDVVNSKQVALYSGLKYSQSIEGIWTDGTRLYVANDSGFHLEGNPDIPKAIICDYEIQPPPPSVYSDILTVGLVFRMNSLPSGSQALIAEGNPTVVGTYGWGIYLTSTGIVRFIANMLGDAGTLQIDYSIPDVAINDFVKLVLKVDRAAGTSELKTLSGVVSGSVTSGAITGVTKDFCIGGRFSIGSNLGSRNLTTSEISCAVIGADVDLDDLLDWVSSKTIGI